MQSRDQGQASNIDHFGWFKTARQGIYNIFVNIFFIYGVLKLTYRNGIPQFTWWPTPYLHDQWLILSLRGVMVIVNRGHGGQCTLYKPIKIILAVTVEPELGNGRIEHFIYQISLGQKEILCITQKHWRY